MIRALIFIAALSLALVAGAQAQFPGYPAPTYVQIGNGAGVPPSWQPNPALIITKNLSDINNAASARNNLGLGSIATQNANAVAITGGTITGLPQPTSPGDAANKQYVDNVASGITAHAGVRLATAATLPANVYNNGTAGVGATLTASGNGALSIDATPTSPGDRVLVMAEAAPANNGIYEVTSPGDGSHKYILTRTADANVAGIQNPQEIGIGSFTFVTQGATLGNTAWVVSEAIVTLGTDPIVWVQFAGSSGGVSSLNNSTGALAILNGGGVQVSTAGTNISLRANGWRPGGRLTLASGTPVMIANVTATSTIYYDCYQGGNTVPVFNGTADVLLPVNACEISTVMPTSGAGVTNMSNTFDIWGVNVAGALTLCIATNGAGAGWQGDTGATAATNTPRGTGYTALDSLTRPYWTNKNALTHCYNGATDLGSIAVNRATYLGTTFTTAAGKTLWQYGAGNVNGRHDLWNAYNRVVVNTMQFPVGSWTWTNTGGWLTAASAGQYIEFVVGVADALISWQQFQMVTASSGATCLISPGLDGLQDAGMQVSGTSGTFSLASPAASAALIGYHYVQGFNNVASASTCTFFGFGNSVVRIQNLSM